MSSAYDYFIAVNSREKDEYVVKVTGPIASSSCPRGVPPGW